MAFFVYMWGGGQKHGEGILSPVGVQVGRILVYANGKVNKSQHESMDRQGFVRYTFCTVHTVLPSLNLTYSPTLENDTVPR